MSAALARVMQLRVVSPTHELVVADVVQVRFDTGDGSRGVLAGHERATEQLREGGVYVRTRDDGLERELFVATEGGMAVLGPREVVLVTSWAVQADTLTTLAELVRARAAERDRIDTEAKVLGHLHETALRRALVGLQREVSW